MNTPARQTKCSHEPCSTRQSELSSWSSFVRSGCYFMAGGPHTAPPNESAPPVGHMTPGHCRLYQGLGQLTQGSQSQAGNSLCCDLGLRPALGHSMPTLHTPLRLSAFCHSDLVVPPCWSLVLITPLNLPITPGLIFLSPFCPGGSAAH